MSDKPIASSLLRQEGPQQDLWQVIYDAAAEEGSLLHDDTVTAIERGVSAEIARLQARIEVLEGSIDYLRNLVDDRSKPGWLPIDTAQEDGEIVLVFDEGAMFRALIEKGRWIDIECDQPVEPPPSHWIPMPKPPAEGEK